jgi:hypothetical protein
MMFEPSQSRISPPAADRAVHAKIRLPVMLLAAALWTTGSAPAAAEVRILASRGGEVGQFVKLFAAVRESGDRVVIDGPCVSACTLVLSMVPRDRICVTRKAALGFHAARWMDRQGRQFAAAEETRLLAETYPPPVRAWITRHGGLSGRLIVLRGRELAAMYPSCR